MQSLGVLPLQDRDSFWTTQNRLIGILQHDEVRPWPLTIHTPLSFPPLLSTQPSLVVRAGDLERSCLRERARRSLRMWLLFATTAGPLRKFLVSGCSAPLRYLRALRCLSNFCDGRPTENHARSGDLYLCVECVSALQSSCAVQNFPPM